jgi:signal transduction histidine kinase
MFRSARLQLTAWYLFIIMIVTITFSAAFYRVLVVEVDRFEKAQRFRIELGLKTGEYFPSNTRYRVGMSPLPINAELLGEIKHRILLVLVLVNGAVFFLSGGLGYLLAGRTLRPIGKMVDEQNRFISDASHEFKTPLTSLKTAFEVYLRNKKRTRAEADTLVTESIEEVNRLQTLSESLLELAQFQIPNGLSHTEQVSLKVILSKAVSKVNVVADSKNIHIEDGTPDITLKGNPYALVDLFVILLDNAIKYSPQKTSVTLSAKTTDGMVLISVSDQGPGIDKKDLPYIFDRFYRSDSARSKTSTGGYGLGLAIAKKIALSHKGTISVLGNKKGSTFTVRLPRRIS